MLRSAVILDPYPLWIEAVSEILRKVGFEVVGTATTPEMGLRAVSTLKPDLLILELEGYATGDGRATLSSAKALHRDLRCIVLSSRVDQSAVQEALSTGAAAYVVKVAHPEDLASAVYQAFEHSVYFAPPRHAAAPAVQREVSTREAVSAVDHSVLTRREVEILALVANGHPNAKIASALWITEQTVKFHLSNIFRKLDVANRTEAARWAHLHGLVEEEPTLSVVS